VRHLQAVLAECHPIMIILRTAIELDSIFLNNDPLCLGRDARLELGDNPGKETLKKSSAGGA
jgi:hypothetical protein